MSEAPDHFGMCVILRKALVLAQAALLTAAFHPNIPKGQPAQDSEETAKYQEGYALLHSSTMDILLEIWRTLAHFKTVVGF